MYFQKDTVGFVLWFSAALRWECVCRVCECVCVCAEIVQQACWRRLLVYSLIVLFVWEHVTERSVLLIIHPLTHIVLLAASLYFDG